MPDLRLPAVCDFSITNVCNAACDFCGFARAVRRVDFDPDIVVGFPRGLTHTATGSPVVRGNRFAVSKSSSVSASRTCGIGSAGGRTKECQEPEDNMT